MQDHIRMDTFCKDRFPGLYCLLMTFFREWRIRTYIMSNSLRELEADTSDLIPNFHLYYVKLATRVDIIYIIGRKIRIQKSPKFM